MSPLEMLEVTEALLGQQRFCDAGAATAVAIHDNLEVTRRIDLRQALGELVVGDVDGAGDVPFRVFRGGAHIENDGRVAGIDALNERVTGNQGNAALGGAAAASPVSAGSEVSAGCSDPRAAPTIASVATSPQSKNRHFACLFIWGMLVCPASLINPGSPANVLASSRSPS